MSSHYIPDKLRQKVKLRADNRLLDLNQPDRIILRQVLMQAKRYP